MGEYKHLVYRITCPSLKIVSESNTAGVTGKIKSAFIHIPKNANSLVEIEVWHKNVKVLPDTRTGIVGDDMNERFNINKPVSNGDDISVIVKNHDDTYSHTVVVIIELEEEK